MMKKYLGCSGFYYEEWKGNFYPEGLAKRKWLEYYTSKFDTLELNSTFYRLPKPETIQNWFDKTPEHFTFSVKGSRFITHIKKLKDVNESVSQFYELIYPFGEKLGAVLWQLQGNFQRNDERLESFCQALSREFINVIEFRHPSWFVPEVYQILEKYGIVCCSFSSPLLLPENLFVTSGTAYLRFHGKKEWYDYLYSKEELAEWAQKIKAQKPERLYVYFNNTFYAQAVQNCKEMERMLLDE
jgi:uncharacterized protein YecE (DUF72 family)